ncbi:MAG TPA: ABC transporter permease subunit [Candidatus Polarisedimenticolaceae bacterium]|nr:ABC transporter permease subunit [Candidatus Polarisedimenticolaceae bacterium]
MPDDLDIQAVTAAPRRRRPRQTSRRVRWIDRLATGTITVGGTTVILAVLGILLYLVWVVLPLFAGARLSEPVSFALLPPERVPELLFADVDEYRVLGMYATRDGQAVAFSARNGRVVQRRALFPAAPAATAFSRPLSGGFAAVGFADGTVRTGRIGFETSFVETASAPVGLRGLAFGAVVEEDGGVLERTARGELRRTTPRVELGEPVAVAPGVPIRLLDYRVGDGHTRLAVLDAAGSLAVHEVLERENLLTGEIQSTLATHPVPVPPDIAALGPAALLLLTSRGEQLYLAWSDGSVARWDLRDTARPQLAERADLVPEPGATLTVLAFTSGEQSLLAGDSTGRLRAWFRVARGPENPDGFRLLPAHTLGDSSRAIAALGISARDKTIVSGDAAGDVVLHHLTSERRLAALRLNPAAPVRIAQLAPKADGLLVVAADGSATQWSLHNPHPEVSLRSLLGRVWYEGYARPEFTWQSSSGTDDFEPKFSLVPLIFGTLKATLYSMLFAVPVALGAAIYSAEFLDRRWRVPLKSAVETMAALPSVVLGFIAALVLAPLVESWVVGVIVAFALIPLAALTCGYVWQMVPSSVRTRWRGGAQFALLAAVILGTVALAPQLGSRLERLLFAGDFKGWLDGRVGNAAPGIAVLSWPLILVGTLFLDRRLVAGMLGRRFAAGSRGRAATLEFLRFLGMLALSFGLAWLAGSAGAALGLDPRGPLVGSYVQRNALVVGFVMGFAVIPIIFTIAEDALSAVPASLRSASLGCGATRWQTALRVVLPVAASGIFSALMVGLGRAVGETMIVLMAAGNTPLIDWNIFNGLRTLSANIAVELPEAAKDGTLYRLLFLAALTLFVLTSLVNTLAEIVRQRFRRRAFQL